MSLNFALKDFYRNRNSTFPFVIAISLVIGFAIFFVYFTISLSLNIFIQNLNLSKNTFKNKFYFSGALNLIYSNFTTLILILILILAFIIVIVVTTSFIISKKKDIAIMKAIGTIPDKLYSFYMLETFIIFFLGFFLGFIFGMLSFGVFAIIMFLFNFPIILQIDLFYIPLLLLSCIGGIFFITGYSLRRIGRQKIYFSFSKDIPYDFDASLGLKKITKWLSSLSLNFKMAVVNTVRRKGQFKRYMIIFSIIFLIIFTLGLGAIVLSTSSQEWIRKSQGENIVVIGHTDVIECYSEMYEMFSDPSIFVDEEDINFLESKYMFNFNDIKEDLSHLDGIKQIDERLIMFSDAEDISGIHYYEKGANKTSSGYEEVGKERKGNFPIIGVNIKNMIQEFEIEGRFFTEDDASDNMTIGDGLAYNFFEYPFDQKMKIVNLNHQFHICGVIIDSFYSGYAGYIELNVFRTELNLTNDEINFILIKLKNDDYDKIKEDLDTIIKNKLGKNFGHMYLDEIFQNNLDYILRLSLYPLFIIAFLSIIAILSLYNYQKAGLMDKAKDFLIMRAIGSKTKSLKKILFLESLFIIIPSILFSLGIGMLINSLILFDRVYLPPLYVPLLMISVIFIVFLVINHLSLNPIVKKINKFIIKDFDIY
ncbi:MAG: ABC transporter permease [Promethearchaeota archaeon]